MKNLKLTIILSGLIFVLFGSAYGQVEKFDVMTFKLPKGWNVEKSSDSYRFTKTDKKQGHFCLFVLTQSHESQGSPKADFQYFWNATLKEKFDVNVPEKMDIDDSGDLAIVQSGASIKYQEIDSFAALVTISSKKHFVSVLAITNNTDYIDEVLAFVSTVDFNFPSTNE